MSALLYGNVEFDQSSNLYTYNYAVQNDTASTVSHVDILVGNTLLGTYLGIQPLVPTYAAPDGWTMYGAFSGWIAGPPYNESGGFYEFYAGSISGPSAIQPNTAAFGWSVTTRFAPTLDDGLNDYFLYGSQGVIGYGNVVVPGGADWIPFPPPPPPYVYGAIPELQTWLMLLIGFVAVGLISRVSGRAAPAI